LGKEVLCKVASNISVYQKQGTASDIIVTAFCSLDSATPNTIQSTLKFIVHQYTKNTHLTSIFNSETVVQSFHRLFWTLAFESPAFVNQEKLKKLVGVVDYVCDSDW
jgi:hypothetical protein